MKNNHAVELETLNLKQFSCVLLKATLQHFLHIMKRSLLHSTHRAYSIKLPPHFLQLSSGILIK